MGGRVTPGAVSLVAELESTPDGLAIRTPDGTLVRAAGERLAGPPFRGRDLLAKATLARAGPHGTSVVDATAGLGADGFHLAAVGSEVTLLEREPLFHALLADALARALAGSLGPAAEAAAGRVTLRLMDAREYLADPANARAQVVYLDPMFPERGKAALPGKGMAVFRTHLHRSGVATQQDAGDLTTVEEAELLLAARRHATRRVVVKRPLRAPPLGGESPSGALSGSTVRFDLYAALAGKAPDG